MSYKQWAVKFSFTNKIEFGNEDKDFTKTLSISLSTNSCPQDILIVLQENSTENSDEILLKQTDKLDPITKIPFSKMVHNEVFAETLPTSTKIYDYYTLYPSPSGTRLSTLVTNQQDEKSTPSNSRLSRSIFQPSLLPNASTRFSPIVLIIIATNRNYSWYPNWIPKW